MPVKSLNQGVICTAPVSEHPRWKSIQKCSSPRLQGIGRLRIPDPLPTLSPPYDLSAITAAVIRRGAKLWPRYRNHSNKMVYWLRANNRKKKDRIWVTQLFVLPTDTVLDEMNDEDGLNVIQWIERIAPQRKTMVAFQATYRTQQSLHSLSLYFLISAIPMHWNTEWKGIK